MLHLRMIVPTPLRADVDGVLRAADSPVSNLISLPGAGLDPAGDVLLCDVDRDAASGLLAQLHAVGLDQQGSIAIESVDLALGRQRRRSAAAVFGNDDDAVVWEEVEARTDDEVRLSATFLVFMTVATLIAAVGVVTDQPILIVGAMVVGPDFGPLAAIAVGIVRRRPRVVWRSTATLLIGYVGAIVVTIGFALLQQAIGLFPVDPLEASHPLTEFIWQPNALSYVVGFLAGIAGVLSLTSAKSGALIGVLISVTTIPAAGAIAVGIAAGEWAQAGSAAVQLGINLVAIVTGGVLTLSVQLEVQRRAFRRRQERLHTPRS
ncbi:putative hydrophobic protein (TIGR00271 family) [Agromyces cerinus]|uniref:DUF389 domain-containing protein n=1 Tax=Agromyces cerinus TaxID=33878 RepID=UPI00195A60E4|nr:DUF389 domain-containing protein [Agromyces cerinus]MBM7832322.1 putative hydrophobic protein (TIGR00271 family) [Agromyces cerinus]